MLKLSKVIYKVNCSECDDFILVKVQEGKILD